MNFYKENFDSIKKIITAIIAVYLICSCSISNAKDSQQTDSSPLCIVYFYSPTCEDCHNVEKKLIEIEHQLGNYINIKKLSIEDADVFEKLFVYEQHYGIEVQAPPALFVGSQALVNEKQIISRLEDVLAEEMVKGNKTFEPKTPAENKTEKEDSKSEITKQFENFSITAVAVAGLLDGINPCAFTTIVFMLSMLSYLGKNQRQLLIVGIGFTVAVFGTYFLLGLGFMSAVKAFSVSSGISRTLAYAVAGLAFVLAGWSFVDFVRYIRTANVKNVTLGLPKAITMKIHKVIREGLNTSSLTIGAISVGVLVALLESVCTGQVYLPVIIFVTRVPAMRAMAIMYLLLYNLMFIIPLVIILVIAYLGVKSQRLAEFMKSHLALMKFIMAVLFAGLGVLLLITI